MPGILKELFGLVCNVFISEEPVLLAHQDGAYYVHELTDDCTMAINTYCDQGYETKFGDNTLKTYADLQKERAAIIEEKAEIWADIVKASDGPDAIKDLPMAELQNRADKILENFRSVKGTLSQEAIDTIRKGYDRLADIREERQNPLEARLRDIENAANELGLDLQERATTASVGLQATGAGQ